MATECICENQILAKNSGFTVFPLIVHSWMMANRTVFWRSVVAPIDSPVTKHFTGGQ